MITDMITINITHFCHITVEEASTTQALLETTTYSSTTTGTNSSTTTTSTPVILTTTPQRKCKYILIRTNLQRDKSMTLNLTDH